MNSKTKKLVFASLFASLTCVATMIIKIPSPLSGYMNLGDSVVLLSGWILGPYGILAAAVGSCLADVFSGYLIYAPVTFVIKGLMAFVAYKMQKRVFIGAVIAELIMAAGYYVFDGFVYGFSASLVNLPANLIQGAMGIIAGVILLKIFQKSKISF